MGVTTVNAFLEIILADHCDVNFFWSDFKSVNECKHVVKRNEVKFMIKNGFQKCTFQKYVEPLTRLAVLYNRDNLKGSKDLVSLMSPITGFTFSPAHALSADLTWQAHAVTLPYFHNVHDAV